MPKILFVCTGNTCRSPMAAALFKAHAGTGWKVDSAGTRAREGQPATENAVNEMAARGLELTRHRSRPVTAQMLADADLILTMTLDHKEALQVEFPEIATRVYQLGEMSGNARDVADPILGGAEDYAHAANEIGALIVAGMERIEQLAWSAPGAGG